MLGLGGVGIAPIGPRQIMKKVVLLGLLQENFVTSVEEKQTQEIVQHSKVLYSNAEKELKCLIS